MGAATRSTSTIAAVGAAEGVCWPTAWMAAASGCPLSCLNSCFSHAGAVSPGLTFFGLGGATGCGCWRGRGAGRFAFTLDDFVWEIPVPGMLTVRVTRPLVFTLTRAPRTPADTPMFLLDTFNLTPGAILIDFRTLNPIVQPLYDNPK
ncbi:hypothetical protein AUV07_08275 [Microbacterium sp. CH1]|nr:hypothetical protein AUV07_08275 [Microbacterium sp. CH1]